MPTPNTDTHTLVPLRRALLRWYRLHRRELPWRCKPPTPYHVLVSEAMLQQTQVKTVISYFNQFIQAYPTVQALAAADEQSVLRYWQGLGYYRRARHLHQAAAMIVHEFEGTIPADVAALQTLPGVGRYTAGAISSIAFGKRAAILDGNVARVLARWYAIDAPINRSDTSKQLWQLAQRVLPRSNPGDFNQALMELGALVCKANKPLCPTCPVVQWCQAYATEVTELLPRKLKRKTPRTVAHHVVAVTQGKRYLFEQRGDKGLWSRMWQLPTAEHLGSRADAATLCRWVRDHLTMNVTLPVHLASFKHLTTHRTISFQLWQAEVSHSRLCHSRGVWRNLSSLDDLPLANAQHRAIALLAGDSIETPT